MQKLLPRNLHNATGQTQQLCQKDCATVQKELVTFSDPQVCQLCRVIRIQWSFQHGCVWKCCVPHCTQWLMIIIPFLNGYFIGNINPTFYGFADHYPYEKWLAIIGNINPTFSGPNPQNTWKASISAPTSRKTSNFWDVGPSFFLRGSASAVARLLDTALGSLWRQSHWERNRRIWDLYNGNLMGVSENSVPLNPMVNDHYPYEMAIIGNIPYFQTNPNGVSWEFHGVLALICLMWI